MPPSPAVTRQPGLPERDERLVEQVGRLGRILRTTPVERLELAGANVFAKLEYYNPVGSLKDRSAFWILKRAVERGDVRTGTTLVESSSGNFASALAAYARMLGLTFVPVIDPNIVATYESFLRKMCPTVVKVEERDDTGGFLKTRLEKVRQLCEQIPGSYWTNQYGNPDGMDAHYQLTGGEICSQFDRLDYIFVGVSTGGTIAGVSRRLKERFPQVKVIAVDAVGSVIFGGQPKRRHIPGIGASIAPEQLRHALIDEVVMVPEHQTAEACTELLQQHGLFVGGSSGTLFAAVKGYLPRITDPGANLLFLCADRGTAYLDTVFDAAWTQRLRP